MTSNNTNHGAGTMNAKATTRVTETRAATATYRNLANGKTYELGFWVTPTHTPLEAAWDHVATAAQMNGWNRHDIHVDNVS